MQVSDTNASLHEVREIFKRHDTNKDGVISRGEFSNILRTCDPKNWSGAETDCLFKVVDKDGSGTIDVEELLKWIFKEDNEEGMGIRKYIARRSVDGYVSESSESDGGASSSSSSSDSGDEAAAAKKLADATALDQSLARRQRKLTRSTRHEEPLTSVDTLYELMTIHHGSVSDRAELKDFIEIFDRCKRAGFSPFMAQLIPQDCEMTGMVEDVSALEMGHLRKLLMENPDATVDDALSYILSVKGQYRATEYNSKARLDSYGLANDATVSFGVFKRLLTLLTGLMEIDRAHLLMTFTWAVTDRFEMTEVMAIAVMEKMFLKVGSSTQHVLEVPVSKNDLVTLFQSAKMLDPNNVTGISQKRLESSFSQAVQHMPKRLATREKKMAQPRGKKGKPRRRHHRHTGIVGRTELCVIFEEVSKTMEKSRTHVCTGPFNLVLTLMERMEANVA